MTKTKIVIASVLAFGFASSAFASDASEVLHQNVNQPAAYQQTQRAVQGSQAYAYAPTAYRNGETRVEQREFNRVNIDAVSSH